MRNRRTIYVLVGIIVIGFIAYVLFLGWQSRDKTATIDIQSAVPDDINVTIDGSKVNSNGKVSVKPGSHTVAAQRSGFASKTQAVDAKDKQTTTVRLLLDPNGQEGYDWARAHPEAYAEYEGLGSKKFDQTSASNTTKYPLIASLPEIHPTWRIDYGTSVQHPNDPNSIAITITYGNEIAKQNAESWIVSQGYKLSDYEILYKTPTQSGN